jgi:hypothetical protein
MVTVWHRYYEERVSHASQSAKRTQIPTNHSVNIAARQQRLPRLRIRRALRSHRRPIPGPANDDQQAGRPLRDTAVRHASDAGGTRRKPHGWHRRHATQAARATRATWPRGSPHYGLPEIAPRPSAMAADVEKRSGQTWSDLDESPGQAWLAVGQNARPRSSRRV